MLNHVQLRDFKPDVVICPNCTQHLMGVRDVQWAADHMSFTYGCAGCGHEIERPVAEDLLPPPAAAAEETVEATAAAGDDVTVMEDHQFPFREWRKSRPAALANEETSETESAAEPQIKAAADDTIDSEAADSETLDSDAADDDITDNDIADDDAPAPFASSLLLPPKPWLDTPVLGRRFSAEERVPLTPKQVFDTDRRDRDSERHESLLPDVSTCTRASALLRDVAIFNL